MHLTHCMSCNKAFATVHILDLEKGAIVSQKHLCASCAETSGMLHQKSLQLNPEMLELIESMKGADFESGTPHRSEGLACPACNLTAAEFKARARMGCPRCYEVFKKTLLPLLERVHDATSHRGRVPAGTSLTGHGEPDDPTAIQAEQLVRLRARLAAAVDAEDYEEAARLRDQIRAAQEPGGNP